MKNKILLFLGLLLCFASPPLIAQDIPLDNLKMYPMGNSVIAEFTPSLDSMILYQFHILWTDQVGLNNSNTYELSGKTGKWALGASWFSTYKNNYPDGRATTIGPPVMATAFLNNAVKYDGSLQTGCITVYSRKDIPPGGNPVEIGSSKSIQFNAPTIINTTTTSTTTSVTTTPTSTTTTTTTTTIKVEAPKKGKGNGGR